VSEYKEVDFICHGGHRKIKPGDTVDHIEGWNLKSYEDYPVVERVDNDNEDPVAYFVGGGFWRTSRLRVRDRK